MVTLQVLHTLEQFHCKKVSYGLICAAACTNGIGHSKYKSHTQKKNGCLIKPNTNTAEFFASIGFSTPLNVAESRIYKTAKKYYIEDVGGKVWGHDSLPNYHPTAIVKSEIQLFQIKF